MAGVPVINFTKYNMASIMISSTCVAIINRSSSSNSCLLSRPTPGNTGGRSLPVGQFCDDFTVSIYRFCNCYGRDNSHKQFLYNLML